VTDALEDDDRGDDVRPRMDFPLNERDTEHPPRRYTRAEVAARMDDLLDSMEPPARFKQQLNDYLTGPSMVATIKGGDALSRFGNDFLKNSGVLDVIKAAESMTKLAGDINKYSGTFNAAKAVDVVRISELVKDYEPPSFTSAIDWASYAPEPIVGSSVMEPAGYLELPPNPVHETNARVGELVEILRAEREDHQRDREHAAEELAVEKRKLARQRAIERINNRRRRQETIRGRWFNGTMLTLTLISTAVTVLALTR
jgi:hypothetical protein